MAYVAFLFVISGLLFVVAYYAVKYTDTKRDALDLKIQLDHKDNVIRAMKKVAETDRFILDQMKEIENAKNPSELIKLYNSLNRL